VLRLTAILLLIASTSSAQDCLTRKLRINISNKDWQRVSGIPAENIEGTFRGKPITILGLKTDYSPHPRVLLLLDTSGSMTSVPDTRAGQQNTAMATIVDKLLAMLPPETLLAVGEFDSKLKLPHSFSSDHNAAAAEVKTIMAQQSRFHGRTPLYAALRAGAALFSPIQPGDSIVVVTDASDNASNNVAKLSREFERSGLRLFAFVLDTEVRSTPEEVEGPRRLTDLIERTGGFMVSVNRKLSPSQKEAEETITFAANALISRALFSQELTVRLPETSVKAEKLKLRFSGLDPKQAKELRLEYPAVIQPCELSTSAATTQP